LSITKPNPHVFGALPLLACWHGIARSSCQWTGTDAASRRNEGVAQHNNKGDKIGSLDTAISNDNVVTINRLNDATTVTVRDRDTGKVASEGFGLLQDGDVRVGVLPEREEILVGSERPDAGGIGCANDSARAVSPAMASAASTPTP
jgi:hypothetical protein